MILKKFSQFIKKSKKKPVFSLLFFWIKKRIEKPSQKNENKILQKELFLAQNRVGDFLIIAKSSSGRRLTKTLYKYILSLEDQEKAREEHNKKKFNHL